MKKFACALMMSVLCSFGFADPVPHMPELEAFLAEGEVVTTGDLKARGAQIELRFLFQSYQDRFGMSEDEVRAQFPDVVMFVGYLGGGKYDAELYDAFKARLSDTHEDLFLRHNALFQALSADPNNLELQARMRENALAMEQGGYSPIRVCGAAYDYRQKAEDKENPMDDDRFLLERVANMLGSIELDTAMRVYIFDKFIDPFIDTKDEDLRSTLIELLEAQDRVDPWIMEMVYGVNHERIAWIKRGTGYAYKVSDEQFDAFHANLDLSIEHLRKAYEIDPGCPQAPYFMVQSVYPRTSLWEREGWTWFGRTLIGCIDYEAVYTEMHHILQDKWHGDMTSRAEFAQWCARPDLVPYGIAIYSLYALERSWWTYGVDYGDADWFWEEEQDAIEAVMNALDLHIAQGVEEDLNYEHSIMAFMEYRYNGDLEKTAAHIRACENGINKNARRKMRFDDLNLVAITLPLSVEETKPLALQAVEHEHLDELELAIGVWEQVHAQLVDLGDHEAADALRDRLQGLRWRAAFNERSGWVELRFDEELSGWSQCDGVWERVDERTVRVKKKGNERETLLVADLDTGYWFEVRARARLVNEKDQWTTCGIGYSRGNRKTDGWDQMRYLSTRIGTGLTGIGWHFAGNDYKAPLPDTDAEGWFEYRLLVKGDQVEGYINDQLVGDGEHPNWKPEKEPDLIKLALGAFIIDDEVIEFSDIRIRKRRPPEKIEF